MHQSLPKEAYIDQGWLQRELNNLFTNTWQLVGVESDLPDPGDYICKQLGATSIFILRNKRGQLAAFHNQCRHRGTELLEGRGNLGGTIVCPYHRWAYDHSGKLRGVPNQQECFPELNKDEPGLRPVGIGNFNGLLFANPGAQSFSDWISPLQEVNLPHQVDSKELKESEPYIYELKCNWKVFYENAIDGYHLGYLHEKTLGKSLAPSTNIWEPKGDHLVWYSTEDSANKHSLPKLIRQQIEQYGLSPISEYADIVFPGVIAMFPNTLITPSPFGISVSTLIPEGPNQTRMEVRNWHAADKGWFSSDATPASEVPGFDKKDGVIRSENWTKQALEYEDFQTEDVWICEKIQRGLSSPGAVIGPLAQGWGAEQAVAFFQNQILRCLAQEK